MSVIKREFCTGLRLNMNEQQGGGRREHEQTFTITATTIIKICALLLLLREDTKHEKLFLYKGSGAGAKNGAFFSSPQVEFVCLFSQLVSGFLLPEKEKKVSVQ